MSLPLSSIAVFENILYNDRSGVAQHRQIETRQVLSSETITHTRPCPLHTHTTPHTPHTHTTPHHTTHTPHPHHTTHTHAHSTHTTPLL